MTSIRSKFGSPRVWAGLLASAIFLSVVVLSVLKQQLGQPGPDGDDIMRLVQVRDLLAGQGWFDLHQYRLGPGGGILMHWSRIPDIPILLLTSLFDLFLPSDTALAWAITVWPPVSLLIVLGGLALAARNLGDGKLLVFTFIIALFVLFGHYRFLAGAIDHHNLQMGFLALAVGASLDRRVSPRNMILSAVMLSLSVAVGAELYPFVAVLCAFHAVDWAVRGAAIRNGTLAFGAALAGAIAVCFFGTVPQAAWGRVYCDALSSITFLALAIGGGGLALCAAFLSGYGRLIRFAGLAAIGAACAGLFLLRGPQCLSNPLDVLTPDMREVWFEKIIEARPLFDQRGGRWPFVAYAIGPSLVGFGVSVAGLLRRRDVRTNLMFAMLLALGLILMLYQTRFYVFGSLLAIIPCALWARDAYVAGRKEGGRRTVYLLALALSNPMFWALPVMLVLPSSAPAIGGEQTCLSDETRAALDSVPPGMILSDSNAGAALLEMTPHSVMYANYHRDIAGISASIEAFGLPPEKVPALLAENQVDYVLFCPNAGQNTTFTELRPGGFLARLAAGEVPGWLQPVEPLPEDEASGRLYRVIPEN